MTADEGSMGATGPKKSRPMRDVRVVFRDPLKIMDLAKFDMANSKRVGDNVLVVCPYHADVAPSCSVEIGKGVFRCHGCQQTGTFAQLIAKKVVGADDRAAVEGVKRIFKEYLEETVSKIIDQSRVEKFHRELLKQPDLVLALKELRGIDEKTIEDHCIGWKPGKDGRYTLPVYDQHENCVNVRYRTLDKAALRKCKNEPGFGSPGRLYPFKVLAGVPDGGTIVIVEGELKALLLTQMGIPAVTGTSGAGMWSEDWNVWFAKKRVILMFDIDEGGRKGTILVGSNLKRVAESVHVATVPLDPTQHKTGGIDDWILEVGATADDVHRLMADAPEYEFVAPGRVVGADTTLPLTIIERLDFLARPEHHGKHVEVKGVIAAEETELFRVPTAWKVSCQEDQGPMCSGCPVHNVGRDFEPEPWCSTSLLKLVDVPEYISHLELKRRTGIPQACKAHEFQTTKHVNVQAIELIPDLDAKDAERDTLLPAFLAQEGKEGEGTQRELHNALHTIRGFPTADPKSGRLVLLAYKATPAKESVDTFRVTPEMAKTLKETFNPEAWTPTALHEKFVRLYEDYASNVTHITGRMDMHLLYDLVYHSVLEFEFNGRIMKGWLEGLVIGDTGQGKSQAFEALRAYYGYGDLAVGANSTRAGLLGSVQESVRRKRFVYRMGKIPLNDRRLVCIEEASGLSYEIIQSLRDARSSGRHEDTKAKLTRVSTRTRLVWIANPRNNRPLTEYPQGVQAVRELIGEDADVRRFDLACFIQAGEVDPATIRNGSHTVVNRHTRELSSALVMWAWSVRPARVSVPKETVTILRAAAQTMAKKFSRRIPLILDTEHDEKLARIAAALAARSFSTDDDGETLVVRPCHAEYAATYLDRLYSSPACGYDQFSKKAADEDMMGDTTEIVEKLAGLRNAKTTVDFILEVPSFDARTFTMVSGMGTQDADAVLGILLRNRAVRPNPKMASHYVKTPGFIALLKHVAAGEVKTSKPLADRSSAEMADDVDF